jgi:hypothetical protein
LQDKIEAQRKKIEQGNPYLDLVGPCRLEDGIHQIRQKDKEDLIANFDQSKGDLKISFFIPASGSGSRMFSALFEVTQNETPSATSISFADNFIDKLEYLPFFDSTLAKLKNDYVEGRIDRVEVLDYVLKKNKEQGLGLGEKPKGLIPFHSYDSFIANPFQEHLIQGREIGGHSAAFHFTINSQFEHEIIDAINAVDKDHGATFKFEFSEQDPNTNAIAFNDKLEPIFLEGERVLTRPAGHGTLINNLNKIDADIIFIRNIDNMQHYRKAETSMLTRKTLAGALIDFKEKVGNVLSKVERNHAFESSIKSLNDTYDLRLSDKQLQDSTHAFQALNRPIRICGMVKNEGQPGGGPFWVKDENGNVSRQIVEKSQISDSEKHLKLLDHATHFNPVELFCSIKNYKGEKFDLINYVNKDHYFIVKKTQEGEPITYIEEPGLWNGAMANWITLFYEIESNCFSPVKTVLDLLDPPHQA